MTTNSPEIDEIGDALERLESAMGAAECHGIMAGLLCAAGWMDKARWLKQMFPSVEAGALLAREAIDALARLYEETARQLDDAVLDFHLLLPDDDEPLDERIGRDPGFHIPWSSNATRDMAPEPTGRTGTVPYSSPAMAAAWRLRLS